MTTHRRDAEPTGGFVEFVDTGPAVVADDDALDLGATPRRPMSRRTRGLIVGATAALAVAAVTTALLVHPSGGDRPVAAASSPTVQSSAGFAAGPILVTVDGHDALQSPELPGLGASHQPVVLDPAPDVVAVLTAALPRFRDVRGGRIPSEDGKFGVYLSGQYDGRGGAATQVSIYTVRAPGTTFGTDQFVSRTRFDTDDFAVRTEVSVFTGSGWWVHVVSLGPDDPATVHTGEITRLLPLAKNPALVATA